MVIPALNLERMLSNEKKDRAKFNKMLKGHMREHGELSKGLSTMRFSAKTNLYNNIVDGVAGLLITETGCSQNDVETLSKESWDSGRQVCPVDGSSLFKIYFPSHSC
jgi:hypothetical protein